MYLSFACTFAHFGFYINIYHVADASKIFLTFFFFFFKYFLIIALSFYNNFSNLLTFFSFWKVYVILLIKGKDSWKDSFVKNFLLTKGVICLHL